MPKTDARRIETLEQFFRLQSLDPHLTPAAAARGIGVPERTLRRWVTTHMENPHQLRATPELVVAAPPPKDEAIEALVQRKKEAMRRSLVHDDWAKLIPVSVNTHKPIAVVLVGDPHVDDDHCDIEQLEIDLSTAGRTPGMYAGHIGDLTNNWVGRLKALYAAQSTRFDDGLRLTQWMLDLCPNLFVVNGNHDMWEKGGDLLRFIVRAGVHQNHGARLELTWPSGAKMRLHARHDFPGRSQFSDTHGMKREILWGHRDHLLVAGHTHVDEARVEPSIDGDAHWMFRISGYKVIDDFAKERGFRPKRLAPSVTVVLDPSRPVPAETVKPFWNVEAAADYLTYLRSKK